MELQLKLIGIAFVLLALVHVIFPTYFKWKTDLQSLSLINKEMMIVHTFFVALVVLLMGLLCIFSASDLINTKLGNQICLGFAIFWSIRFFVQFFGYSTVLWKGKHFETIVHIVFSIFWAAISFVFWKLCIPLF
jgi:hypothetical protein